MDKTRCGDISRARMLKWASDMGDLNATPALAVSVAHGPRLGELHVFTVKDLDREQICGFLRFALRELERGVAIVDVEE